MASHSSPCLISIRCTHSAKEALIPLLEDLKKMGDVGASRVYEIDDSEYQSHSFDGDGSDQIFEISTEMLDPDVKANYKVMRKTKVALIEMGKENPKLQPHLREVIAYIDENTTSQVQETMMFGKPAFVTFEDWVLLEDIFERTHCSLVSTEFSFLTKESYVDLEVRWLSQASQDEVSNSKILQEALESIAWGSNLSLSGVLPSYSGASFTLYFQGA